MIPSIILHVEVKESAVGLEHIKTSTLKENKIGELIISALQNVENTMANKLKLPKEMLQEIEIELSLPMPKVILHIKAERLLKKGV